VRNSFVNKRITVNSKKHLLRESNRHALVAYYSIGKHLARIWLNTTSSEANPANFAMQSIKRSDKSRLVKITFQSTTTMEENA